jgi:hypothetical protein
VECVEYLFNYVRDEIIFDFLSNVDDVTPWDVFKLGRGQCNNKTVLFYYMLNYLGFNVRAHFSTIDKNIHRGFFPRFLLLIAPAEIGHSWIDLEISGRWIRLDAYINDKELFIGASKANKLKGWKVGHSVAESDCGASAEFSIDNNKFVQMEAVKIDLGATKDPLSFVRSRENPNNVNNLKKIMYKLFLPIIQKRVRKIRSQVLLSVQ